MGYNSGHDHRHNLAELYVSEEQVVGSGVSALWDVTDPEAGSGSVQIEWGLICARVGSAMGGNEGCQQIP